jgi:hypothetical protein
VDLLLVACPSPTGAPPLFVERTRDTSDAVLAVATAITIGAGDTAAGSGRFVRAAQVGAP